jgi:hypothetical protein
MLVRHVVFMFWNEALMFVILEALNEASFFHEQRPLF